MKRFKVFKKLCSLALILSMLVSMIPINVFATEATQPQQQPTIDPTQKGSLTINKKDSATNDPVSDISFSIYQVFSISADDDGVITYSVNDKFQQYFDNDNITHDMIDELNFPQLAGNLEEFINEQNATENKISPLDSATTDTDGKAEFEDLNLGYYLVIETDSDRVDTVVEPFLVSIPTTVNGAYWEYNVEVTAKNVLSLTEIILKKTDGEKLIDGAEFTLEKLVNGQWESIRNGITTTNGIVTVNGLFDQGTYRFRETKQPDGYILNHDNQFVFNVKLVEVEQGGKTIKKLEFEGGSVSEDGAFTFENGKFTLTVNNEKPTVDKTVNDNDVKLGDEVTWTITATVPSTIKELKTFKLIDTLSQGLDYDDSNADNLLVKQGDKTLTRYNAEDETGDYKVTINKNATTGETELVIEFITDNLNPSIDINVLYKTKVNEKAVIGEVGNPNHVELEYSTTTNQISEDKDTTQPGVDPKVYTFGLKLVKENNVGALLEGAEFKLCTEDGKTCYTKTTDASGILSFSHLESGNYVLTEIKAPAGYNLLKEPINIQIVASYVNNKELSTVIATANGENLNLIKNQELYQGYFEIRVLNQKGFQLPDTGGMGTVIFTVAGLGIMGLAGAAYIALKRKESQQ